MSAATATTTKPRGPSSLQIVLARVPAGHAIEHQTVAGQHLVTIFRDDAIVLEATGDRSAVVLALLRWLDSIR